MSQYHRCFSSPFCQMAETQTGTWMSADVRIPIHDYKFLCRRFVLSGLTNTQTFLTGCTISSTSWRAWSSALFLHVGFQTPVFSVHRYRWCLGLRTVADRVHAKLSWHKEVIEAAVTHWTSRVPAHPPPCHVQAIFPHTSPWPCLQPSLTQVSRLSVSVSCWHHESSLIFAGCLAYQLHWNTHLSPSHQATGD